MVWILRVLGVLVLLLLAGALLLLAGNLWMVFSMRERVHAEADDISFNPVGLILGTSPSSHFLEERLQAGAQLYRRGKVDRLLVTGDSHLPSYDEVGYMRNRLQELGVPADAILVDPYGLRTLDSIVRAREIFGIESATVVTQRFHTYRALYLAQAAGLPAVAYAHTQASLRDRSAVRAREWFARAVALLDVHVLQRRPQYPDQEAGTAKKD